MLPKEWRMCIHCVRVSLNPMTGVSVKRFERALGPEKRYINTHIIIIKRQYMTYRC